MHQMTAQAWRVALKAANRDDAESLCMLGYYVADGVRTRAGRLLATPDLPKAREYLERAAVLGSSSALIKLAELSSNASDTKAEMRYLRKALRLGDASAAYNLGICYRDLGCPRHAFQYYERAAALGELGAHVQIGLCAMLGHGTAQDFEVARKHFELALDPSGSNITPRDREDAQYWLALLNLLALVDRPQRQRARSWLLRADADGDHVAAAALLNVIGRKPKPASRT
ncbi:tetratricopeptide repeat protein [Ahniella affigens]|nr:SEL1-like repeat protein [Ahniella affigens]